MSDAFHYAKNGQTRGPVSLNTVRQLVASGELAGTDYVISVGGKEWLTADKVIGTAAPAEKAAMPKPAAVVSAKSETGFRFKRDGQELGPVGFDEIKRLAADGKVRATDMVSEDGGQWKPAARHRGVFAGRRCEVNGVTFLHPKDWWVTVEPIGENTKFMTITVESEFVAFTISVYAEHITSEDVERIEIRPEKGVRVLRNEIEKNEKYKNLRFTKATTLVGGERAEGLEFEATAMGLQLVGRIYAVTLSDRTVTMLYQASDERFDSIRPVAELICGSFAVVA